MYDIIDNREEGGTVLEQAQLVMLKMLKVFANICEKHNLQYWLDAGTLLGVVRHGGFIPWDDDLDIGMPRVDYEKFKSIVKDELPNDIYFQVKGSDKGNPWRFIKLRDKYSTIIQKSELKKNIKYHQGIFIDIFPYDYTSKSTRWKRIWLNRKFQFSNSKIVKYCSKLINILAVFPVKIIGYNNFKRLLAKTISANGQKNYYQFGLEMRIDYFEMMEDKHIFPLNKMKFVDDYFCVPNDSDKYLTIKFGDYMKIPKKEQQLVHAHKILPFKKCGHKEVLNWIK